MTALASLTGSVLTLTDSTGAIIGTLTAGGTNWTFSENIVVAKGGINVKGIADASAEVSFSPDEDSTVTDTARILSAVGGSLSIDSYYPSSWVKNLIVSQAGHITKPRQPAFLAVNTAEQDSLATDQWVNLTLNSEITDLASAFASNQFTAPVSGNYLLAFSYYLTSLDTAASTYTLRIFTSNRSYTQAIDTTKYSGDLTDFSGCIVALADMDLNDVAYCSVYQVGGSAQSAFAPGCYFSGHLAA